MIRLATWNIRLGIQQGPGPIADALRGFDADVVALQEVGRYWVMGPSGDTTHQLARAAGYPHAYFVPSLAWYPPAQYGHAVLSRHPLVSPRVVRLPRDTDEQRTWLEVRIGVPGSELTLISTHLSHVGDRPAQGDRLRRRVKNRALSEHIIVMGDLNQTDVAEPWMDDLLNAAAPAPAEAPTFPANAPKHRIDWILSTDGEWVSARTPNTGDLSDHLPVVAELDL